MFLLKGLLRVRQSVKILQKKPSIAQKKSNLLKFSGLFLEKSGYLTLNFNIKFSY